MYKLSVERAREIVRYLSMGIDPSTGKLLPESSIFINRDVKLALDMAHKAMEPSPTRNAGKKWTQIEENKLRDEYKGKMKISEIAKEHGRSYPAIIKRLDQMGLRKMTFKERLLFKLDNAKQADG